MLTRPSSAPDRPIAENELFSTYSTRQSNDSLLPSCLCVGLRRRSDTQLPPYQNLYRLDSSLPFADREKGPRTFPLFFFLFLYWAICVAPIRQITYETASINLDRGHQSRTESSRCTAFVTKRSILLIGNSEFLSSSRIEMSKWCKNFASPKYGSNRCICNE